VLDALRAVLQRKISSPAEVEAVARRICDGVDKCNASGKSKYRFLFLLTSAVKAVPVPQLPVQEFGFKTAPLIDELLKPFKPVLRCVAVQRPKPIDLILQRQEGERVSRKLAFDSVGKFIVVYLPSNKLSQAVGTAHCLGIFYFCLSRLTM